MSYFIQCLGFLIGVQWLVTGVCFAQAAGGGGSTGGGIFFAGDNSGCEEGRKRAFTFVDSDGRQQTEMRECTQGSYMTAKERASYIYDPELQCNGEGRQILKTYLDRSTGVRYQVEVVCRKGQWRTLNGQNPLDSW